MWRQYREKDGSKVTVTTKPAKKQNVGEEKNTEEDEKELEIVKEIKEDLEERKRKSAEEKKKENRKYNTLTEFYEEKRRLQKEKARRLKVGTWQECVLSTLRKMKKFG